MNICHICTYFSHQQYTDERIHNINISLTNLTLEGEEQISLLDNIPQREKEMKLTKIMDELREILRRTVFYVEFPTRIALQLDTETRHYVPYFLKRKY